MKETPLLDKQSQFEGVSLITSHFIASFHNDHVLNGFTAVVLND